ncbi:hypothetical protein TEA_000092 [Camellia sinensis var. sinensis]|uniref:HMA domain-containing protein n=1 Tax=Camellia sinensis var. sinensis TaxID=542762 RepID=A0A4S4DRI7_CAMSN|nr:hypothetical protein TEA_000092 [Camellia sinensis var. sinensis]
MLSRCASPDLSETCFGRSGQVPKFSGVDIGSVVVPFKVIGELIAKLVLDDVEITTIRPVVSEQKVVIKVSMNGQKSRSKALKKVVGVQGVEAAALQGQDKIEVTGESMDVIGLTTSLRKKSVGYADW